MYLSLATVLKYLNATATSRCFIEEEAILYAEHLILCGISKKMANKWTIKTFGVQSSGVRSDLHKITGELIVSGSNVYVYKFEGSCKAEIPAKVLLQLVYFVPGMIVH